MHENEVVVPDVVGMTFEDALRVAVEEGVSLANPDPDGPPIGAIAWRQNARVFKQHPEAGVRADRNDSVTVYLDGGDGTFAVVHAEPPHPVLAAGHGDAHADPSSRMSGNSPSGGAM